MASRQQVKNEQQVRIPFVSQGFEGRSSVTTKDQRFVNMYIEKINDDPKYKLIKRPGILQDSTIFASNEINRGGFGWNGNIWSLYGTTLYKGTTAVVGFSTTTTSGNIGYTYCTVGDLPAVFFCDGVDGWVLDSTDTITKVTDVDFPTPHIPTPVYIDGYVCIPRADSADIYNCDLNNPLGWTASNFITSELFPDNLVSLARQNNQIVAFGSTGTEFFYDAANATGTPFAKNSGAFLQIGSCAPFAIGQNERYCFFIGQSQSGGRSVWKLDGFQPTQVSTDAIDRILDAEGVAINEATSFLIRLAGHFFYVIHLTSRTLVLDIDLNLWHEWSTTTAVASEGAVNQNAVNTISMNGPSNFVLNQERPFPFRTCADIGDGKVYLIRSVGGLLAHFDTFTYQDIGQQIKCSVNTAIIDFGTYQRKFLQRMSVVGDLATNDLYITWSDNDYQSWSALHVINMQSRPVLHRLGATRRRAFNLYYVDNYPLRLDAMEFTLSVGET